MGVDVQYPRGSEWRKWDLHVHLPSAGAQNDFTMLDDGQPDWMQYCDLIEASDVAVFGLADYFSLDRYFEFLDAYQARYPDSDKVFFPNMEVRLNEAVNKDGEEVNVHFLFPASLSVEDADRFMRNLKTELHTADQRAKSCRDLSTPNDFSSATVTRENITRAIQATFGIKNDRQDSLLIITSCKGDGIRPLRGAQRKENLTDEIDKLSDGFFGRSTSTNHFLDVKRLENPEESVRAKPVFAGCDAHTFEDLRSLLGHHVVEGPHQTEVTWVKADPTFEGLRQTLVEPRERVRIQAGKPDMKEPYNLISRVTFAESSVFPSDVIFNSNLCSVIGSRSSGKSALLAYIAHAVDPEYTKDQQVAATVAPSRDATGPAAGRKWSDVPPGLCRVEWGDSAATTGQVIYIPQNSLYAISERPEEITQKIQPALYREDPDFEVAHRRMTSDVKAANEGLVRSVREWFRLNTAISDARHSLSALGDRDGVASVRDSLAAQIEAMRADSPLTPEQTSKYQALTSALAELSTRAEVIEDEARRLSPYVEGDQAAGWTATDLVSVRVESVPEPSSFPGPLGTQVNTLLGETAASASGSLVELIVRYRSALATELAQIVEEEARLRSDNAPLIQANEANVELDALVRRHQTQIETLQAIEQQTATVDSLRSEQSEQIASLAKFLRFRKAAVVSLLATFSERAHVLDELTLGIEAEVDPDTLLAVSQDIHRQSRSDFLDADKNVNLHVVTRDPAAFLSALASGGQRVRQGRSPQDVAAAVLQITPEVRFFAELDGDRIGGFKVSTMTPGKQALFALSLILNESSDRWPLLIDQPEDDLDSRSIFEQIVPYLLKRKSDRQIIMVTHDANLAVGADSEQIVVANRHGDDRPNAGQWTFDYMSGSLEHSSPVADAEHALEVCGIREHACLILDGGEDAFRKRRQKYQI